MYRIRKIISALVLAITILGIAGCSPDSINEWVPAGMKKISTDMVDYDLYIPSEWSEDNSTGVVTAYVSSADRTSVSVIAFDLNEPNQTPAEYWDNNKESFTSFFTDMEMEAEGDAILLGDIAANEYIYTANASGLEYKFKQVICINKGTVYILTYTATAEKYEAHLPDMQKILEFFSFKS